MKVKSKIFRGIEFIQLTELPQTQQEKLLETLNHNNFIKIMIDGKIITQCLQYKDYSFWYENVFKAKAVPVKETTVREQVEIRTDLAFK